MKLIGLITTISLIGLIGLFGIVHAVDLSGFAWSENIGWLSFSSANSSTTIPYGVTIDKDTGYLSGYAWSEHLGWVKFDPVGPYPAAPLYSARVNFEESIIEGWARVCAATENSDCSGATHQRSAGWDGWLKLAGSDYWIGQIKDNATGKCYLSGWAWGSTVLGWLHFNGSTYSVKMSECLELGEPPVMRGLSCEFNAFPERIIAPQRSSRLTWTCVDADECSINQGIGNVNNVGGSTNVNPSRTATYTLSCSNSSGQTTSKSVTVTVIRSRICETIPFFPGCPR